MARKGKGTNADIEHTPKAINVRTAVVSNVRYLPGTEDLRNVGNASLLRYYREQAQLVGRLMKLALDNGVSAEELSAVVWKRD